MATREINVTGLIDGNKVSSAQVMIYIMCFLIMLLDGFDTQAVSYIAPALREDWHLVATQLSPVFGASVAGVVVGSFFIGPIADRIGRRKVLLLSVFAFGLLSLISAWSSNLTELTVLRFLTGLGLGGAIPNGITIASEYSPRIKRGMIVAAILSGFSVGSALAGFTAAILIQHTGWRSVLVVGGVLPLVLLPFMFLRMPESIRFLIETAGRTDKVGTIMRAIEPTTDFTGATFTIDGQKQTGSPVSGLFKDKLARVTVVLWCGFFCSLLMMYLIISWLPLILHSGGISLRAAAITGAMFQVGGIAGALVVGWLCDRFDPPKVIATTYFIAALATASIGYLTHDPIYACVAVTVAGFFIAGSHIGVNSFSPNLYPTNCRATGVSWLNSIGRFGSVLGSTIGGAILALHLDMQHVFLLISLPAIGASLFIFILSAVRQKPPQSNNKLNRL
ncbi:MFS transporter [Paraburkholderia fungorum]|nr:MFS transporter [Paraburkholderia fungorum]